MGRGYRGYQRLAGATLNNLRLLGLLLILAVGACDPGESDPQGHALSDATAIGISLQSESLAGPELDKFSRLVGRAKIVGLGESRHDTKEQFEIKSLLAKHLIRDLGFRVLVFEESFSHALALDSYVITGNGDLRSILNGLAGWYLWDTEEMVGILEWIRQFNETVPAEDMVRVFGMDITAPALGIRRASRVADKLDPSSGWLAREYGLDLHAGEFWPQVVERYATVPLADAELIRTNLGELADFLEAEARKPDAGPTVRYAAIEAQVGSSGHAMFSSDGMAAIGEARERGMTDVVDWIVSHNGVNAKTIIWTHNLHAAKTRFRMPDLVEGYLEPMGMLLDQTYGTHYLAVGGTFGTGEYTDEMPPGRRRFEHMGGETIDGAMTELGYPAALLDFTHLGETSRPSLWLATERAWRMQDGVAFLSAGEGFDAIYYVERVSRAQLTPRALQRYKVTVD